jgi:hypothetical protein
MYNQLLAQLDNDPKLKDLTYHEKADRLRTHPEIANEIVRYELVNPAPPSHREGELSCIAGLKLCW